MAGGNGKRCNAAKANIAANPPINPVRSDQCSRRSVKSARPHATIEAGLTNNNDCASIRDVPPERKTSNKKAVNVQNGNVAVGKGWIVRFKFCLTIKSVSKRHIAGRRENATLSKLSSADKPFAYSCNTQFASAIEALMQNKRCAKVRVRLKQGCRTDVPFYRKRYRTYHCFQLAGWSRAMNGRKYEI
jgi:hypothetical protein